MSLQGLIRKLQDSCARTYLRLASSFVENGLFRETLASLAQDKEEQAKCLKNLPSKYWSRYKKEKALITAVKDCMAVLQRPESEPDRSMQSILSRAFDFEEPIILKIYAPLIRDLRTEWKDHTLDFYILTKAHVVRLARIAQSFSGNPVIISRSMTLLESFEKAVQAPDLSLFRGNQQTRTNRTAQKSKIIKPMRAGKKHVPHVRARSTKRALKTHPLGDRTKTTSKPAKPPLKKLALARRRARP
jgi:hypothetical protein